MHEITKQAFSNTGTMNTTWIMISASSFSAKQLRTVVDELTSQSFSFPDTKPSTSGQEEGVVILPHATVDLPVSS